MPEVNSWIGVVALAVAGTFAWLSKRDSIRMNLELALVKAEQVQCKKDSAQCEERHKKAEALLELKTRALEKKDETDKAELQVLLRSQQAQISRLRKQSAGKDSGDADTDH